MVSARPVVVEAGSSEAVTCHDQATRGGEGASGRGGGGREGRSRQGGEEAAGRGGGASGGRPSARPEQAVPKRSACNIIIDHYSFILIASRAAEERRRDEEGKREKQPPLRAEHCVVRVRVQSERHHRGLYRSHQSEARAVEVAADGAPEASRALAGHRCVRSEAGPWCWWCRQRGRFAQAAVAGLAERRARPRGGAGRGEGRARLGRRSRRGGCRAARSHTRRSVARTSAPPPAAARRRRSERR